MPGCLDVFHGKSVARQGVLLLLGPHGLDLVDAVCVREGEAIAVERDDGDAALPRTRHLPCTPHAWGPEKED